MSVFTNPADGAKEAGIAYTKAVLDLLGDKDPMQVLGGLYGDVQEIISGLSDAQLRQPEMPDKWSMLEVIQHLADSELVWAYRLRSVAASNRAPLTGYDQDLWADQLCYEDVQLEDALAQIQLLRGSNLRLIDTLTDEQLQRVGVHNERGEESIAHMIKLYAGHDLVHLRQLRRIRETVHRD